MVLVPSKQHPSKGTNAVTTVAFRLFLPCVLLVAFLDVKSLRFLRHQNTLGFRGYDSNETTTVSTGKVHQGDTVDIGRQVEKIVAADTASVVGGDAVIGADEASEASKEVKASEETKKEANTGKNTTKTTTCLDPNGPQPYVLLARGRSGSGSTLQVLGTLTGKNIPGDHEFTGSTPNQARKFFYEQTGPNDGGQWVVKYLCEQQRQHPDAGVVAFKWKPYSEAMFSPAALAGLDLISRAVNPTIKVVRLRRNLLDNFISDRKHELTKVSSHCNAGNVRCVRQHKQAGANLTLSVPDLLTFLEAETNQEDEVDKYLVNMSVPHIHASYEKLYHQDNADEWMKIFKFLGVGPGEGLTREQVDGSAHAFTGSPHHREAILNYNEVEKGLKGTRFEKLLHP